MSTRPTIQSTAETVERVTAEYIGVLTDRKAGTSYAGWPNRDVERILPLLRPGDRCGPDGAFVVVDPRRHQHLPELRELFEPTKGGTDG